MGYDCDYDFDFEETEKPKPTEKQIKKFCEDNLCKHCFYHNHGDCKLGYSYFWTSRCFKHKLVKLDCFTAKIKPEEKTND